MADLPEGSYTIQSLSKQGQNYLHSDGTQVLLSHTQMGWYVKPLGGEMQGGYTISAPQVGRLQVLAQLKAQDLSPARSPYEGPVAVEMGSQFAWSIQEAQDKPGSVTIRALETPPDYPSSGSIYLVYQGEMVGWKWDGGIVEHVPSNAFWVVNKQA